MEKKIRKLIINKDVIKRLDKGQLGDMVGAAPKTYGTVTCTCVEVCQPNPTDLNKCG